MSAAVAKSPLDHERYAWKRQPKSAPTPAPQFSLTTAQRGALCLKLQPLILKAMLDPQSGLAMDAIYEGRIGLDEMSDADLVEFARDCWGVEV